MMDRDEQWYLDRLRDRSVSHNDKSSCLDVLEVLLPGRGVLPVLAAFISDTAQPDALRHQAEKLARAIDPRFDAADNI